MTPTDNEAPQASIQPVFRNRTALAGWVFMSLWLGLLLIFSVLFLTKGGFGQFGQPLETGIMLLFWLFGIGGAAEMFSAPLISARRDGDMLVVTERWPIRVAVHRVELRGLPAPDIVKTTDSDGDDYFRLVLRLTQDKRITLHEGNDGETAQARRADFLALVRI